MFVLAFAGLGLRTQPYLCVHGLVLACVYLFFSLCACRFQPAYACSFLSTQDPSYARMAPGKNPSLGILAFFSSVFHLFAILKSFLTIFASHYMPHLTSHSIVNPISLSHYSFHLIMNLISFSFIGFSPIFWQGKYQPSIGVVQHPYRGDLGPHTCCEF